MVLEHNKIEGCVSQFFGHQSRRVPPPVEGGELHWCRHTTWTSNELVVNLRDGSYCFLHRGNTHTNTNLYRKGWEVLYRYRLCRHCTSSTVFSSLDFELCRAMACTLKSILQSWVQSHTVVTVC